MKLSFEALLTSISQLLTRETSGMPGRHLPLRYARLLTRQLQPLPTTTIEVISRILFINLRGRKKILQ